MSKSNKMRVVLVEPGRHARCNHLLSMLTATVQTKHGGVEHWKWAGAARPPGQSVPLTFDHQGGAARVASFSVLPRYAFSSEVLIVLSAKKVWKNMAEAPPQIFCLGGFSAGKNAV